MKLADRNHSNLGGARKALVEACIKARGREVERLLEDRDWARNSARMLETRLAEVDGDAPLDLNRQSLDAADRLVTALRAHVLTCRRHCKTIADRDTREENGVLKP